ncbi:hypothetical protein ElyMa_001805600 [Elysia marginata]|uniref:Uncharacterized protein n=1 Tax=Elysia marginata TaxID=1093978 RepID=A0AAV4EFW3_9GAST|nr:hypothetical protein ElyMa_001805600 [Elysia marginata]
MKDSLIDCFTEIIEASDVWDGISVREAFGLRRLLENAEFLFFLNFFNTLLSHVDVLFNSFQSKTTSGVDATCVVEDFKKSLTRVRENLVFQKETSDSSVLSSNCSNSKRRRADPITSYLSPAIEVCDTLDTQLTDRFENSTLVASFCIVDPKRFPNFAINFPEA